MKILIFISLVLSFHSHSVVWTPKNSWFEKKNGEFHYENLWAKFIKEKKLFNPQFYKDNNLKIDCADLPISSYIIFSAIHKLPIIFHDTYDRSITNLYDGFDDYPHLENEMLILKQDGKYILSQRLIEFINFVTIYTGSHTLAKDSFLIKLDPKFIKEGTLYIKGKEGENGSGHAIMLSKINRDNSNEYPLETVMVSVPREIKEKFNYASFLAKNLPAEKNYNFRKIYPGVYEPKSIEKIRRATPKELTEMGYDHQKTQFNYKKKKFDYFALDLMYRLNSKLPGEVIVDTFIEQLKLKFNSRKSIVDQAFKKCVLGDLVCEKDINFKAWDNYSTPSRDDKIYKQIKSTGHFMNEYAKIFKRNLNKYFHKVLKEQYIDLYWIHRGTEKTSEINEKVMKEQGFKLQEFNGANSFKIYGRFSLRSLCSKWLKNDFSSEPSQHFLERWGFENFYRSNF